MDSLNDPVQKTTDILNDLNSQPHIEAEEPKREQIKKISFRFKKTIGIIAGVFVVAIAFAALFGGRRTT